MANKNKSKNRLMKDQQELHRPNIALHTAEPGRRQNQEEMEEIFNLVPDMIVVASIDGRFKRLNPAWEKTLGFTVGEMLSRPFTDFIHPDDVEPTMKEVKKQLGGEATLNFVNRYRCKDGSYKWLEWVAAPVKNKTQLFAVARDITERKQIEKALRETEERFRIIFSSVADGLVLTDVDTGRFHSCNKMFSDMVGYSEEEIKNLSVADIHPKEDLPHIIQQFRKLANRETTVNNDIPVKRKDGSIFYADIHAMPITLAGKAYLIGTFRDITERRRSEEVLHRSEERFRSLVETSSDLVWEHDSQWRFTYLSPVFKEMFGYETDEFINRTPFDFMPEFERKRLAGKFKEVSSAKMPFHQLEIVQLHKNGQEVVCEISGNPIFSIEGEFQGMRGITRDITERKKAEELLKEKDRELGIKAENLEREVSERKRAQEALLKINETLEERVSKRTAVLDGIARIFRAALSSMPEEEMGGVCLGIVEEITQSEIGFIGEITAEDKLCYIAKSDVGRDPYVVYDEAGDPSPRGDLNMHRVYEKVLAERKAFYSNDPSSHLQSIGLSEGHSPFKAFLGAPLIHSGQTIGVIAVGNRENGYRDDDVETIEALAPAVVEALLRVRAEKRLRERERDLEIQKKNLEDMNTALNVLLKKRDNDKEELGNRVLANIRQVVEPYMGKLQRSGLDKRQKALADIIESNLKDIISSFIHSLSSMYLDMTPKEITIANLIRQGMTSKEICEVLGASDKVVAFHRHNIRKKLGLLNKKINLTSYLQSKFR